MTESPKSAKYICTLLGRQNHFQATSWNQSTAAIHFQCNFCSHSEKLAKWLQTAWQPLHKPCTTDQRSCFPRLFNFVSVPNIQMYSNFGGIFCVFLLLLFMAVLLRLCLFASNDYPWSLILSSTSEKYLAHHQLSSVLLHRFCSRHFFGNFRLSSGGW